LCGKPVQKFLVPNLVDSLLYRDANRQRQVYCAELRIKYGFPVEAFIMICPARLTDVKGLLPFLRNAAPVLKERKAIVVIAGDGPLRSSIINFAKYNELDVRLMGQCTAEVMVELYAAANVFLLPSLSDPNPLSVIEAAWAGLPLAVSKYVGNHPELVEEGVNGVVFDTLDKENVIENLGKVLSWGSDKLVTAGQRSYELAKERFFGPAETNRILDELESYITNCKKQKK
jgi:glycosyltransferase involved in cell wall biosynthesis